MGEVDPSIMARRTGNCCQFLAADTLIDKSKFMATGPFRAAFWCLLASFLMSTVLLIPNSSRWPALLASREARAAEERKPPEILDLSHETAVPVIFPLPMEEKLAEKATDEVPSSEPYRKQLVPEFSPALAETRDVDSPDEMGSEKTSAPLPAVKVASADPNLNLGLPFTPPPWTQKPESEQSPSLGASDTSQANGDPQPVTFPSVSDRTTDGIHETHKANFDDRNGSPSWRGESLVSAPPATVVKEVLVPIPYERPQIAAVSPPSEPDRLLRELMAVQIGDLKHELRSIREDVNQERQERLHSEIESLKSELQQVRFESLARRAAPLPPEAAAESQPTEMESVGDSHSENQNVTVSEPDHQTVEVTEGQIEGTKTFRFTNAKIAEVLATIGDYSSWNVIVSPEIDGVYSGEFRNVKPDQAFAIALKTFRCSLAARGTYSIVRPIVAPDAR